MPTSTYAFRLREIERRFKHALETRDMDAIQAALREMNLLTRVQYGLAA